MVSLDLLFLVEAVMYKRSLLCHITELEELTEVHFESAE